MNFKKIICGAVVIGSCLASVSAYAEELTSFQYFERGVNCQSHDKVAEAIENYSKAVELDAFFAPSFYNRGVCLIAMGEKEKALVDFNKAIELNAKYVSAYNKRGEYYLAAGEKEKALADFNQALVYAPSNKQALEGKAKCAE